ncbi:hypothetical protein A9B99_18585 [Mangrovibacter phragmitis]|uniref:Uncharacterized protein n=1 Tax=Mangrovibacter phragmitis TaxID=1691903 RepID=A0A1B7L723_9ENTR|nr:hypothetical protein [Mangrovibacter phragmitis]OAT78147.1 hypothetical protein A9B99_18585 [Mangrovibacter phragmitis]
MATHALTIGPDKVEFSTPPVTLNIGYATLAAKFTQSPYPSEQDVENAIMAVENCIHAEKLLRNLDSNQVCNDSWIQSVALSTGCQQKLTQDNIECLFNDIVDIIAGRPKRQGEFPDDPGFIAYVTLLRELSHHLNIQSFTLHN